MSQIYLEDMFLLFRDILEYRNKQSERWDQLYNTTVRLDHYLDFYSNYGSLLPHVSAYAEL